MSYSSFPVDFKPYDASTQAFYFQGSVSKTGWKWNSKFWSWLAYNGEVTFLVYHLMHECNLKQLVVLGLP